MRSEAAQLAYATALFNRGMEHYVVADQVAARTLYERAVEKARPWALVAKPSRSARYVYSRALRHLGNYQNQMSDHAPAVITLTAAIQAVGGAGDLNDDAMALAYLDGATLLHQALLASDRLKEAEQVATAANRVAAKALQSRPEQAQLLDMRAKIALDRAIHDTNAGRPGAALEGFTSALNDTRKNWRADPANRQHVDTYSMVLGYATLAYLYLGRPDEGLAYYRQMVDLYKEANPTVLHERAIYYFSIIPSLHFAEIGDIETGKGILGRWRTNFTDKRVSDLNEIKRLQYDVYDAYIERVSGAPATSPPPTDALRARLGRLTAAIAKSTGSEAGRARINLDNARINIEWIDAKLAVERADYAGAVRYFRAALPGVPSSDDISRHLSSDWILLAEALFKTERAKEGAAIVAPLMAGLKRTIAAGGSDFALQLAYAHGLYFQAMSTPTQSAQLLTEAAAIIEALPVPVRSYRSVKTLRDQVAQARRTGFPQRILAEGVQ